MTGDTSYWRGLIHGLMKIDSGLQFLLYSNTPKPKGIPENDSFQWIYVPGSNRFWSLVKFPIFAKRAKARAFHTQYNLSPLIHEGGITTIHDVSFFIGPEWFSKRDRLLLQTQIPRSVKRAERVITVSETSRSEIEKYIPEAKGKIIVTPNALGENIRPLPIKLAREKVQELGITPHSFLLSVGTRWPRKNMNLAVSAAKLADIPLVLTGKSGWGEQEEGAIQTGYVPDDVLASLYQCARLYLAPSRHEGFGIPLLEAFACECPVMCSAGGALPEVAGQAAHVVPDYDPANWANQIRGVLADSSKLEDMREKGRKRVLDFDWKTTAQLTVDGYREVIG